MMLIFQNYRHLNVIVLAKHQHSSLWSRKYFTTNYLMENFLDAVATLNTLFSNAADQRNTKNRQFSDEKLVNAKSCIIRSGISFEELKNTLPIIHISGTKGKGSTSAFCERILNKYGFKTGLFTSPHLISVEERIRINGDPISKELFSEQFWKLHDSFKKTQKNEQNMPPYFSFLFILALKIFLNEKVDVAILEVGIGGEFDSTNAVSHAKVVGITSLGYEHTQYLGNTIEEIAWQKAGIMKPNTIAITSAQQPVASLKVLRDRAAEKQCYLYEAPPLNIYHWEKGIPKLGIDGPLQHLNASVALQIVNAFMYPDLYKNKEWNEDENKIPVAPVFSITKQMVDGLTSCECPGRTQVLRLSLRTIYYLDGAHTAESMEHCVNWYCEKMECNSNDSLKEMKKILIFNVSGIRIPSQFFGLLKKCNFDYVYFCALITYQNKRNVNNDINGSEQQMCELRKEWLKENQHYANTNVNTFMSAEETIDHIKQLEHSTANNIEYHVLVCGSLYLVGNILTILQHN